MARRRMFSKDITESDAFLEMPPSSQLLYFHLAMNADDEGFVGNPRKIMRMCGFADDDLKILLGKRFLLVFETGVLVIKHWLIHNTIRMDRFCPTTYQTEKKLLQIKENKAYTENGNQVATIGEPSGNASKDKLSKDKLSKDKLSKDNISSEQSSQIKQLFDIFYRINPTINWGNKTSRQAAADLIKRFGLEGTLEMAEQIVAVQGQRFAPVCTTPYQMKEKLAQFKIYFDSEKNKKPKIAIIS